MNTLNGNVELGPRDKEKLEKFKYSLRKLLKKKSIKLKKKILLQEGGFLQVLLPSAITLIGTLIEHLVNRKETKKWMVVPYEIKEEENNQKINASKLDTIIKDVNLKDDDKVNDYNI